MSPDVSVILTVVDRLQKGLVGVESHTVSQYVSDAYPFLSGALIQSNNKNVSGKLSALILELVQFNDSCEAQYLGDDDLREKIICLQFPINEVESHQSINPSVLLSLLLIFLKESKSQG